jgi:hypothetical protein
MKKGHEVRSLTSVEQRKAVTLLMKAFHVRELFESGQGVDGDADDTITCDIRVFLISIGAVPDRRKNRRRA